MHIKNKLNLLSLFVFFAGTIVFAQPAFSGYDYMKETPQERAVFAYFRAAGTSPDYEYWIKNSSMYRMIVPSRRREYLLDEMTRLGRGFGVYEYDNDVLELTLQGIAKYTTAQDNQKARLTFLPRSRYKFDTTFEFSYGEEEITLFVDNLEFFRNLELNKVQAQAIEEKVPFVDQEFTARMELKVRVTKVDDLMLMRLSEGQAEGRGMRAEIAFIRVSTSPRYNMEKPMLWDYVAPWYRPIYEEQTMDEDEKYPHPYEIYKE